MAIKSLRPYVLVIMILNAAGWSNTPVLAAVHREGEVLTERADDDGMHLRARLDGPAATRLREFVVSDATGGASQ